jgi:hypothetical protein
MKLYRVQPAARGMEGRTSRIRGTAAPAEARVSMGSQWAEGIMGHRQAEWKIWPVREEAPEAATQTSIKTLTVMEVLISAITTAKLMEGHADMAQENLGATVIRVLHP